jgi:hypothetical protein
LEYIGLGMESYEKNHVRNKIVGTWRLFRGESARNDFSRNLNWSETFLKVFFGFTHDIPILSAGFNAGGKEHTAILTWKRTK